MTNDAGDDGNSLSDTFKRSGVIGSMSKTQVLGGTLQNDAIKRALSFSDSPSPLGKAVKRSEGIGLAFYQEHVARTMTTMPMFGQLQEAMLRQDQVLRELTGMDKSGRMPWDSEIKALRASEDTIGRFIAEMNQTRELAKSWDRDLNFGVPNIGDTIRALNAQSESVNRIIGQLGEPFELASRLSRSVQYQAWQAAAVGQSMQALVDRALADLEIQ